MGPSCWRRIHADQQNARWGRVGSCGRRVLWGDPYLSAQVRLWGNLREAERERGRERLSLCERASLLGESRCVPVSVFTSSSTVVAGSGVAGSGVRSRDGPPGPKGLFSEVTG